MGEFAFELVDTAGKKANIKVIGVGGSGGNAIEHMLDTVSYTHLTLPTIYTV